MTDQVAIDPPLPAYRTRLDVLFAQRAPVAVILRRGPKKHFQLILWGLKTDTFTSGQWMVGTVRLCDLSPDGRKLIYWATQYHLDSSRFGRRGVGAGTRDGDDIAGYDPLRAQASLRASRPSIPKKRKRRKTPRYLRPRTASGAPLARQNMGVWTAISTPPYFSALAIWPCFGHWTGGGVFVRDRQMALMEDSSGMNAVENVTMPSSFSVVQAGREKTWHRSAYRPSLQQSQDHVEIVAALQAAGAQWVEWVSLHEGRDMLFACDGVVYRLRNWRDVADGQYLAKANKLIDLSDRKFEPLRAPDAAMRW